MSSVPYFILQRFYSISLIFVIISGIILSVSILFRGGKVTEVPSIRLLRILFGFLWLIDGLLQLQPIMSVGFIVESISPGLIMGTYQPWLASLINSAAYTWNLHPITYDAIAASIQIFGGSAMLIGPRGFLYKLMLALSIPWSLGVWVIGEGFGNSISTGASWIIGSPGSVLFYLIASVILILHKRINLKKSIELIFATLFAITVIWQVIPQNGYWDGTNLAVNMLVLSIRPQPQILSNLDLNTALALYNSPLIYNALISVSLLIAALLWIIIPGRISAFYTIVISFVDWIFFLDLGGLFTGSSTDPNTPIPVIFLAIFYLTVIRSRFVDYKIEHQENRAEEPKLTIVSDH